MKREIKFRGWDYKSKEMCYLESWAILKGFATIMQFTGLKDKNEKEIYEGDILKITEELDIKEVCIAKVFYDECSFVVCVPCYGKGTIKNNHLISMFDNLEVIGNIYQNPELLGDKKCYEL